MSSGTSCGSLLRLFQSEFFDAHLHMHYLHRMEQSGVQDYLVNELYKMTDDDIDFYLPQLCQIALLRFQKSSLHRFLLDKAAQSMHFALKIHWLVQSICEDMQPDLWEHALAMVNMCETAMVNSSGGSRASGADANGTRSLTRSHRSNPDLRALSIEGEAPVATRRNRPRSQEPPPSPAAQAAIAMPAEPSDSSSRPPLPLPIPPPIAAAETGIGPEMIEVVDPSASEAAVACRSAALRHLTTLARGAPADLQAQAFSLSSSMPNTYLELGEPVPGWLACGPEEDHIEEDMRKFMMKRRRCDYFNTQNHLVSMIMKLSNALAAIQEKEERKTCLANALRIVNRWMFDRRTFMTFSAERDMNLLGLHIPLLGDRDSCHQILHIHVNQCRIFSSATRAPFLLVYESADLDEVVEDFRRKPDSGAEGDGCEGSEPSQAGLPSDSIPLPADVLSDCIESELDAAGVAEDWRQGPEDALLDGKLALWSRFAKITTAEWRGIAAVAPTPPPAKPPAPARSIQGPAARSREEALAGQGVEGGGAAGNVQIQADAVPSRTKSQASKRAEQAVKTRELIWGEPWREREERIRQVSPFRRFKSWSLGLIMVKGGDDLRQELLAAQIIEQFRIIFKEASLPLWLRATKVLVTSSSSGFIEFIRDSQSIDGMKKHYPQKSLAEIFKVAFADKLFEAKKNFIESCAAYSLVVWFLQVKDRHNGNLMMTSDGHVIHIDFGFMLSNSPGGNMAFEQSPFKLTQEFLDVMDGECSEQYEYFRTLVIRGFLEARKHRERIILQVRMMLTGSKLPCFREGADFVLQTLTDRFFVNLTEEACIEKIVDLIDSSVNNWRTIQYDNYQRLVHGIL